MEKVEDHNIEPLDDVIQILEQELEALIKEGESRSEAYKKLIKDVEKKQLEEEH
ncbi:MAG: hypothetical protein R2795_10935 [Saprospiraceae bacterium]